MSQYCSQLTHIAGAVAKLPPVKALVMCRIMITVRRRVEWIVIVVSWERSAVVGIWFEGLGEHRHRHTIHLRRCNWLLAWCWWPSRRSRCSRLFSSADEQQQYSPQQRVGCCYRPAYNSAYVTTCWRLTTHVVPHCDLLSEIIFAVVLLFNDVWVLQYIYVCVCVIMHVHTYLHTYVHAVHPFLPVSLLSPISVCFAMLIRHVINAAVYITKRE